MAFFPAVLGDDGGIYASSSDDGVTWRRPRRLLASDPLAEWRTADYPIDGGGGFSNGFSNVIGSNGPAAPLELPLLVERGVVLEHGKALEGCVRPPSLCAYNLTLPSGLLPIGAGGAPSASASDLSFAALPPPAACPTAAVRIAMVMRGEAFRWGCSASAQAHQRTAIHSHVRLAARLEQHHSQATGGRVAACARFYVAVDDRHDCGGEARRGLLAAFGERLASAKELTSAPPDQGAGAQAALTVFTSAAAAQGHSVSSYARLVISRLDVTLLSPQDFPWGCSQPDAHVCLAAKCEEKAWRSYRCVSDLIFRCVTRPHLCPPTAPSPPLTSLKLPPGNGHQRSSLSHSSLADRTAGCVICLSARHVRTFRAFWLSSAHRSAPHATTMASAAASMRPAPTAASTSAITAPDTIASM